MLFRCAKGFMQLPPRFRREERAKQLLEKGLELVPESAFGNHSMAQYYERIEKVGVFQSVNVGLDFR